MWKVVTGVVAFWLAMIALQFAFWGGLIYLAVRLVKA